jgi:hypothetical protein
MGAWVQGVGEQLGVQLGQIIAESLQRSLESSINVADIARRLGASSGGGGGGGGGVGVGGGRGRRARTGDRAICGEPGCGRPVLAKGLCRSHYYRARYRAQKAGTLQPRRRGRKPGGGRGRGRRKANEASSAAGESTQA